jgi:hypothetical protein
MSVHVQDAIKKFKGCKKVNIKLGFLDFICECYVKLPPCSYGKKIEKKIKSLIDVIDVKTKEDRGDFRFGDKYGEIKVSFLSDNSDSYTIRNIRLYQDLNYYLMCLIDCDDNFTPNFYLIPKDIMCLFSMCPMNGTKESNKGNDMIGYGMTVKKNSLTHALLERHNMLDNTDKETMIRYFSYGKK